MAVDASGRPADSDVFAAWRRSE